MITTATVSARPPACDNAAMTTSVVVHERGPGEWAVRAQQEAGGEVGIGEVIVRLPSLPLGEPPHGALARARAWIALGDARLSAGDLDGAIACARAGLEALGPHYAGPDVSDDTGLKLMMAEERLVARQISDAANIMMRMLRARASLYAEKHAGVVVR